MISVEQFTDLWVIGSNYYTNTAIWIGQLIMLAFKIKKISLW